MKNLRNLLILMGLAAATILGFRASAQAADQPLALKGYDPVAYFTENARCSAIRNTSTNGTVPSTGLRRPSISNLFKADPDRYLPQYKNWCAASVARGEKVHGNPEWWLVVDGRLYLFGKPMGPA